MNRKLRWGLVLAGSLTLIGVGYCYLLGAEAERWMGWDQT